MSRILQQSEEMWLAAAENALKTNRSSFAVLDLTDVVRPDGLLSSLASRGYTLIGPTWK